MPYLRPGVISYHVATKQVTHGNPCIEDGTGGIAIKQQEQSWQSGISNRNVIQIGESFAIAQKGVVQIPASLVSSPAKGDPLFIVAADNTLVKTTAGGRTKWGVIISLAGDNRGTPTGFIRVDLDARDSI